MSSIQLFFEVSEDGNLKSITFSYNDTELPSNSETLKILANAILKSIEKNRESQSQTFHWHNGEPWRVAMPECPFTILA